MLPARRPYPDELCSSAVFRCCRQFNAPFKPLGAIHLGRASWRPAFLGASPLLPLAELFNMPAEDLLWQHTVFPYATAAMAPELYGRALERAYDEAGNLGSHTAAVIHNVTRGVRFRRFCPQCIRDDTQTAHESFWHRSHHLPGVDVCTRHQCFLHETDLAIAAYGTLSKAAPSECLGRPLGRGRPSAALVHLAKLSTSWLDRWRGDPLVMSSLDYRREAIRRGWLSETREVDAAHLAACIRRVFSRKLLVRSGAPIDTSTSSHWASMMLRPATKLPFAPVKHALLQTFLAAEPASGAPPLDRKVLGPPRTTASALDRFYSSAVKKELARVLKQGDRTTTEKLLKTVGSWGAYRRRRSELPKLQAVVDEFRESKVSAKRLRAGKRRPPRPRDP
ncbi:TniQ family protein [Roseateles noduli]|uniref:TniQ family protein n=1 Tax=Roseateles noduli TaxID=2052484 RepID=UPI003D64A311